MIIKISDLYCGYPGCTNVVTYLSVFPDRFSENDESYLPVIEDCGCEDHIQGIEDTLSIPWKDIIIND